MEVRWISLRLIIQHKEEIYVELKAWEFIIFAGTMDLVMIISSSKFMTTVWVAELVGITSTHLVK